LGFSEGKEKMVACTDYPCAFGIGDSDIDYHKQLTGCAFYLHIILKGAVMKRIFLITILFLVFLLIFFTKFNNDPKFIISKLSIDGIQPSRTVYRMYFLGLLPVGEAVFNNEGLEEYRGQKVYHLSASAQNLNILSKIFKAQAVLNSYVDRQSFNPITYTERLILSGKDDEYKEVYYDQRKGIMTLEGVERMILPNTQDPLSAMLSISKIDFDKTNEFEININSNQKNYILKGSSQVQDLTIRDKMYTTYNLKANIRRRDKNPYHKSSIAMTLLKSEDNIPVFIKVFAGGVLLTAKLIDVK